MAQNKKEISWIELKEKIKPLLLKYGRESKCYGVPRGGQYLAPFFNPVDSPEEADFILDDLVESGATKKRFLKNYPNTPFEALYDKTKNNENEWLVFPWELKEEPLSDNIQRIAQFMNWEKPNENEKFNLSYIWQRMYDNDLL